MLRLLCTAKNSFRSSIRVGTPSQFFENRVVVTPDDSRQLFNPTALQVLASQTHARKPALFQRHSRNWSGPLSRSTDCFCSVLLTSPSFVAPRDGQAL